MNKVILFLIGLGVVAIVIYGLFNALVRNKSVRPTIPTQTQVPTLTNTPKNVDYIAGFAVYTNGTFRIFTATMYHNLSEDVFIEANNPNRVYVKKAGVTWDDFFKSLPMKLSRDCLTTGTGQAFCTRGNQSLKFYINGFLDPSALDRIINSGDKLLVSFGNETEAAIQKQLQQIQSLIK